MSLRSALLNVNDEEGFASYSEKVVYEMQRLIRLKDGMDIHGFSVIDLCARIEDLIYNDSLKEYGQGSSSNVWAKRECIIYYQETVEKLVKNLEYKQMNWKKLLDDNEKNPQYVLSTVLKDEQNRAYLPQSLTSSIKLSKMNKPKKPKQAIVPNPPPVRKAPGFSNLPKKKKEASKPGPKKAKPPPLPFAQPIEPMNDGLTNVNNSTANLSSSVDMAAPLDDMKNLDDNLLGLDNMDGFDFDFDGDDSALDSNIVVDESAWLDAS